MQRPSFSAGGFAALLTLLWGRAILCRETPGDFVTQVKGECFYLNGTDRMRYVRRYSYNQQQFVHFDSERGVYEADSPLGIPTADLWNSLKELLERRRAAVYRVCRYNYKAVTRLMQAATGKPKVTVSLTNNDDPKKPHRLVCNVNGFYPYDITIKWFKNGEEDPDVLSSDLLRNGDWTGQVLVMLETTVQYGDTFVCQVKHSTLQEPIKKEWQPESSESAKSKMVTGIVGFVLGGIFFILGIFFCLKNKKALPQFNGQPEGPNLMN